MAKPFMIAGTAAPLPVNNLDTDQIMPKQFLLGIDKSGLARGLLHDLRLDADGHVRENFVLNRPEYKGAKILIGGANFGCGSSREHAVWGLQRLNRSRGSSPNSRTAATSTYRSTWRTRSC
jgi:3-isopropylmalate/(R)-2-methylmalate dehydratase small subunit